jgi:hypothetical protein
MEWQSSKARITPSFLIPLFLLLILTPAQLSVVSVLQETLRLLQSLPLISPEALAEAVELMSGAIGNAESQLHCAHPPSLSISVTDLFAALRDQEASLLQTMQAAQSAMQQVPYTLRALLVHDGMPEAGHYWAHIAQPDGTWRKCNDAVISEARSPCTTVAALC